ncbi:MAG TPA: hypothetical protein VGC29_05810 [Flavisolibacter sp.]
MRKILLCAVAVSVLLTSCDLFGNFGKKVEINEKNHVYYKGDGVTEDDAKKLGNYFVEAGAFDGKEEKSIQLSKDGDAYVVRLVIKEDVINKERERYETIFWYWQDLISENVFEGKKTKVILTDDKFKDLVTLDEMQKIKSGDAHFVYYKGKGITEKEAKEVASKFEENGIFPYTTGSVLLTKEKGGLVVRFLPSAEQVQADKDVYYATLSNLQYLVGKYVLDNKEVKLVVIDEEFNDVKKFDELTADQKMNLDMSMNGTAPDQDASQYTGGTEEQTNK